MGWQQRAEIAGKDAVEATPWLVMNGYSMALAVTLFIASFRDGRSPRRACFTLSTASVFVLLLADCICRINIQDTYMPQLIGSVIDFGFDGLLSFFWILYVTTWIEGENVSRRERLHNRWVLAVGVCALVNLVAVIINIWTGWFFFFDADGVYNRGPFSLLRAICMLASMMLADVYILIWRKNTTTGVWAFLALMPVVMLIGAGAQALIQGLALEFCSFVFTMFLVYIFARERSVNVDTLTGIGNRRMIDIVLEASVRQAESGPSFSAFLIDLDLLKSINDTYGHNMGDRALAAVGSILRAAARTSDSIARFGGDEFYMVTDVRDREELDTRAQFIRGEVKRFNARGTLPFDLGLSMGYDIYDPERYPSLEEFKRHLDELLYEEKAQHHGLS